MKSTILRLPVVLAAIGKSRSALYTDIQLGLFTRPVAIGPRAVGWPSNEVTALVAARIAGKSIPEIMAIVERLQVARKSFAIHLGVE